MKAMSFEASPGPMDGTDLDAKGATTVSFQAYIDNIEAKTGKTPADFRAIAAEKGLLNSDVKAGHIVAWLKEDFGLGHGHSMAIYATLKPHMGKA
jgi:hypothetical protein